MERKNSDTVKTKSTQPVISTDAKSSEQPALPKGGAIIVKVKKVYERGSMAAEGRLGDYIILEVENFSIISDESKSKNKRIILYINGFPIKGAYPNIISDTTNKDAKLEFYLNRSSISKDSWDKLLRRPELKEKSEKSVRINIGLEDENEVTPQANNFSIVIFSSNTIYEFIAVLIVLLLITVYLGVKTPMLREPGMIKSDFKNRPYSLALTQMAFWSFLIIASFLALFIVTKEFPPITGSVLTLIGISSGTALGSLMINYNKFSEARDKDNRLNAEKNVLRLRIEEIDDLLDSKPLPVNSVELQNERDSKKLRYYELAQTQPFIPSEISQKTKGFFNDVLSDTNGISLYRFQIAVWTIIIGYIFVINVYNDLSMPQFDNTLLGLMGISSGTYLGFKIPEKLQ